LDTKRDAESYRKDIGLFVKITAKDPDTNKFYKVYGVLKEIVHPGLLRIVGNDGNRRHVKPENIENYDAGLDRFNGGGKDHG
jgi:hypothetical protein